MPSKYSYRLRREYARISDAYHSQLVESSKNVWRPCIFALIIGAVLSPIATAFALIFAVRALFPGLPGVARWVIVAVAVLLMYVGPRVLLKATNKQTLTCIKAATFEAFVNGRSRAG